MDQRSIEKVRSPPGGGRPEATRAHHQEPCQERQTGCADIGAVAAGRSAFVVTPRASSGKRQMDLTVIRMRDNLIETRTRWVTSVRGVVKATGGRLASGETSSFPQQVGDLIPEPLRPAVAPVLEVIDGLNEAAYEYDCLLEHWAGTGYEESSRLTQIQGVGTLTALTFMLTVGDKERFSRTRDIGAYLGLRPRLGQSGDHEPERRITKAGDGLLRKTLVECAHYMVGPFGQDSDLRRWGLKMIAAGNGSKRARQRAVVGVARRLAVLLMSLWKSGQSYDPLRHSRAQERSQEVAA